jgi:hypothetical protein
MFMIHAQIRKNPEDFEFDIALSFAGEDRKVAEDLADLPIEQKISVFYDLIKRLAFVESACAVLPVLVVGSSKECVAIWITVATTEFLTQ